MRREWGGKWEEEWEEEEGKGGGADSVALRMMICIRFDEPK